MDGRPQVRECPRGIGDGEEGEEKEQQMDSEEGAESQAANAPRKKGRRARQKVFLAFLCLAGKMSSGKINGRKMEDWM
jgi:hypothetical protein